MSAKIDKPCNFGIKCHGAKNGKCPYTHPEVITVCKEIVMCRNGWACHGRANGRCYFTHPTEEPQKIKKEKKEIAMCRNGWACHGRVSGKCWFTHPTEAPPTDTTK